MTEPKQILFVDDSRAVLNGLRRQLYPFRSEWAMRFSESGEAALRVLDDQSADVVVSDMRMPGMDGAQVLQTVARRYPRTARLMLSGYTNPDNTQLTKSCAHRFLLKPCPVNALRSEIRDILDVRQTIDNGFCTCADAIWSHPPRLHEDCDVVFELLRPGATNLDEPFLFEDNADAWHSLRLLAAQVSAKPPVREWSMRDVMSALGDRCTFALAMSIRFFDAFIDSRAAGCWDDAVRTAILAAAIAAEERMGTEDTAYALMAGLLHGVADPRRCVACQQCVRSPDGHQDEDVIGRLLPSWGIPDPVGYALGHRWRPAAAKPSGPLTALLAAECTLADDGGAFASSGVLRAPCERYLESVGLANGASRWRAALDERLAPVSR